MTLPTCQTPSKEAGRVGDSGADPPKFGENVFVADVAADVLDVPHRVNANSPVVTACIQTTRCVGAVDSEGFLLDADQQVEGNFLAGTLVLTVRGLIRSLDAGGLLGTDGLDVEVVMHRGSAREVPLGRLEGGFLGNWENYTLDVPVGAVKFPADPCPTDLDPAGLCGLEPQPRSNEISFVFSGIALPPGNSALMSFTIDWLSLAPKVGTNLAVRPVMFVHGWFGVPQTWEDSVWTDALLADALLSRVIELPKDGRVAANGALVTRAVQDLTRRFGVERIAIVSHSKGGVDCREHIRRNDDVEVLIMIGTPNEGTPLAYGPAKIPFTDGARDMTPEAMRNYNNQVTFPNFNTAYVTVSGSYDSFFARKIVGWMGPNDEVIPVDSVQALFYTTKFAYDTSVNDVESRGICAAKKVTTNHSCLLYKRVILDDIRPTFLPLQAAPVLGGGIPQDARIATSVAALADEPEALVQLLASAAGVAADGVTDTYAVVVDPVEAVTFQVAGDPAALDVALVSPGGSRSDATTQDPAVTRIVVDDLGPMSYTGFAVESPETGTWTVEVTGTALVAAPADEPGGPGEPAGYSVTAMAPLVPGVGVAIEARVERTLLAAGQQVTVLATLTQDGVPVTDATVGAVVTHPDRATTTEVAMPDDGTGADVTAADGVYTAVFTDTAVAGTYEIEVSAARTEPAFTRVQPLQVVVTRSGSTFSGVVTDHGGDGNGDGGFEQLVVDVGISVDLAATYRLYATLAEAASSAVIEQVRVEVPLEPGPQSVALAFSGTRLFDQRIDGPYLVTDLALEDVDTATVIALGDPYTTGPYTHTQFQGPACVLTGATADRGVNEANKPLEPFEELAVDVEVDLLAAAHVEAGARLRDGSGTLIDVGAVSADLPAGPSMLSFTFQAARIFRSGLSGPYTLQELTLSGTTESAAFSLSVTGVVAVTQPYAVEDFGPSPSFTVGGTVTGLVGVGLILERVSGASSTQLRVNANGPFTFLFPELFGGNDYEVRVKTQPGNPAQVCTVVNGTGVIADADVTDVQVNCLPPA
jgi:pimeloyl-ACP methyl ester carboxylesterase